MGRTDRNIWDFYIDDDGKHRWRVFDLNGDNLFISAQGYVNLADAQQCAKRAGWAGWVGADVGSGDA